MSHFGTTISVPLGTSGSYAHGSTYVLTGSGFGTKTTAAPKLWDTVGNQPTYSALVEGNVVPDVSPNPWADNSFNGGATYYTEGATVPLRHSNVTAHYYGVAGKGYMQYPRALGVSNNWPSTQLEIYASWYFRPDASISGGSSKVIRIWDHNNGQGTRISWTQMHLTHDGTTSWGNINPSIQAWNRLEFYCNANTNVVRAWVNGALLHDVTDFVKRETYPDIGLTINRVGFDGGGVGYAAIRFDYGEIYVDTTYSRVEIGNAATWAACTVKEVQLPTAWSDSSITFTVNKGGLPSGTNYLYTVDSSNNPTMRTSIELI